MNNNDAQFLMLANKFNEAVEVILELSHKARSLREMLAKIIQSRKNVNSSSFSILRYLFFF